MTGQRAHRVPRVVRTLEAHGHRVRLEPTSGPGDATAIAARSVASGADLIVVAGGDGTINEAANGMAGSTVPLAILPGGTANVLANELGLGSRMRKVAASLSHFVPARIAVGCLRTYAGSPRLFLMMAGVGLDATIVLRVDPSTKKRLGKFAYWLAAFGMLRQRLPQFRVRVDGRELEAGFALAARVRNYGGQLEIARTASILEDRFEVVIFQGDNPFRYLRYLGAVVAHRLAGCPGVEIAHARKVEFQGSTEPPIPVQVDGEYAGRIPARVEIVPAALTLLVPPGLEARYAARRPRG